MPYPEQNSIFNRFVYLVKKKIPPLSWRTTVKYVKKTSFLIEKGARMVGDEAAETQVMAKSFFRILENKLNINNRKEPPTEAEVKAAIEQLKDVGRFSLFATVSILPGGGFSLIGLELLARKFGVRNFTLVPSAFRKKKGEEKK